MNRNNILCYDLETGALDPNEAQIIQICGKIIDPYTLQIKDTFSSWMKPDFDKPGIGEKTIIWHAEQKGITKDEMLSLINQAPDTSIVWGQWVDWVQKYNKSKNNSPYDAPIPAGYNIINYDNIIIKRYCKEYGPWDKKRGDQKLFNQVWKLDMMDHMFFWFESVNELPKINLTDLMSYMGYDQTKIDNAHDAEVDVDMTCQLIIKFLNLQRYLTEVNSETGKSRLKMKGCLA